MKKQALFLLLCVISALQVAAQTEFLNPKIVKLNGKIPVLDAKLKNIVKELGAITHREPDDLKSGAYYVAEEAPSNVVRIKGVELETCVENAHLRAIDFSKSPDVFISWSGGRIDNATTLQDIRKRFPRTAKEKTNQDAKKFWIRTLGDSNDVWILEFNNGKITKLIYHIIYDENN
ncbi:hypothetical protein HHL16_13575 [Pseudoflavitalea sp. G-6-1-2]|uniref:hypothetical protein n=1 Tax=Pseudoflavitalea sp. G-6-1-2 TaxID=2728841 RepID=UPI00146E02EB|nr:hypothetical protein [Pseudoflavitalea sp. G-6-1-2]NML21914.1 hypothetical protein [Pseudoflavitalea sp. G-6-1-2]